MTGFLRGEKQILGTQLKVNCKSGATGMSKSISSVSEWSESGMILMKTWRRQTPYISVKSRYDRGP